MNRLFFVTPSAPLAFAIGLVLIGMPQSEAAAFQLPLEGQTGTVDPDTDLAELRDPTSLREEESIDGEADGSEQGEPSEDAGSESNGSDDDAGVGGDGSDGGGQETDGEGANGQEGNGQGGNGEGGGNSEGGNGGGPSEDNKKEEPPFNLTYMATWVIVSGSISLLAFLGYVTWVQNRFYGIAEKQVEAGGSLTFGEVDLNAARGVVQTQSAGTLKIGGISSVKVGKLSTEYVATVNDQPPSGPVIWSIDPPEAAAVVPQQNGKAQIVAAKAGAFKLKCEFSGQTAEISIAGLEAEESKIKLPFVGKGAASFYVAILLITFAVLLGLLKVLSSESVATLLGAMAGYLFGFRNIDDGKQDDA